MKAVSAHPWVHRSVGACLRSRLCLGTPRSSPICYCRPFCCNKTECQLSAAFARAHRRQVPKNRYTGKEIRRLRSDLRSCLLWFAVSQGHSPEQVTSRRCCRAGIGDCGSASQSNSCRKARGGPAKAYNMTSLTEAAVIWQVGHRTAHYAAQSALS